MSIATAPLHELTLQQWLDGPEGPQGYRSELVGGHCIMTPPEQLPNSLAEGRLLQLLIRGLPPSWLVLPMPGVLLRPDPAATMRVPDLVVVRADVVRAQVEQGRRYVAPGDVVLAVEVVSPSSVEVDWVVKRAEYAAAGIPTYLLVDVREEPPVVVFFDRIVAGPEGPRYAAPTGDGTTARLQLDGHVITISAADLI